MEGETLKFPKPVSLIKLLINQSISGELINEDEIILDFFAGTGTTAQAVFELNKEDELNRKFILVQLPEQIDPKSDAYKEGYKTIADICKERIRRVIGKDSNLSSKLFINNNMDLGFKCFSLFKSNINLGVISNQII